MCSNKNQCNISMSTHIGTFIWYLPAILLWYSYNIQLLTCFWLWYRSCVLFIFKCSPLRVAMWRLIRGNALCTLEPCLMRWGQHSNGRSVSLHVLCLQRGGISAVCSNTKGATVKSVVWVCIVTLEAQKSTNFCSQAALKKKSLTNISLRILHLSCVGTHGK